MKAETLLEAAQMIAPTPAAKPTFRESEWGIQPTQ
jgi:hypothetical protein